MSQHGAHVVPPFTPSFRCFFDRLNRPRALRGGGQSVEEAGVKREQNTGFFEIEVQKEGEGEGNKADGNPATCV